MNRGGRFVALFRAINVGGRGKIAMADLRDMGERLGLSDPRTVLQTGNLVFEAKGPPEPLEKRIEAACAERFSLETAVMLRGADDWQGLTAENPFKAEARDDPAHLVLLVLKGNTASGAQARLEAAIKGREKVHIAARSAYVVYPNGIGRSKLTAQVLERHLETRVTGRNWNTVMKIAASLSS